MIAIIRILDKGEFGLIAYALTVVSFFAPFVGAGLHQGFLRYGALSQGQLDKKVLFDITLKKGFKYTALMIVLFIIISPLLSIKLSGSILYLLLIGFQLLGLFLFQMIQIYCRMIHRNKLYAILETKNNLLLLISNIGMAYFFGGMGYVISIICVPLFMGLYYLKKLKLSPINITKRRIEKIKSSFPYDFKELFSYGLYTSAGGVISQLLFAIDILLIGNILTDSAELIAQYKASSIIPFSLLMISIAVITTDFVKLTSEAIKDKNVLKNYYLNYLKIFSIISIGIFLFFYFFSEPLLSIFGEDYKGHARLMNIFAVGVIGGLLIRIPMGNMLSVIGWPKVNAIFSAIVLVVNLITNYFMIKWYGIEGAAITTSALMWFSGFLSLGAFVYYLQK